MRVGRGFRALSVVVLAWAAPLGAADEAAVRDFIRQTEDCFAAA